MKVLVIQIKHIGDAVATSMLFKGIKQRYPKSETHYMVTPIAGQAVNQNPYIDSFFFVDANKLNSVFYVFQVLKQVRRAQYDVVIDVYGKAIGNLCALISSADKRIGYDRKHSRWAYTDTVKTKELKSTGEPNAIRDRKQFLLPLKIDSSELSPTIFLSTEEQANAREMLETAGLLERPVFMVGILGSTSEKSYPDDYMAMLLDKIIERHNVNLIMNYSPDQRGDVQKILDRCKPVTRSSVNLDVYGSSLREFLALLSHCNGLFGNEGGATNMAKALSIPTFSIFSPQVGLGVWSGKTESGQHDVAHLSMYCPKEYAALKKVKHNSGQLNEWYRLLKPECFLPELNQFIVKSSARP